MVLIWVYSACIKEDIMLKIMLVLCFAMLLECFMGE